VIPAAIRANARARRRAARCALTIAATATLSGCLTGSWFAASRADMHALAGTWKDSATATATDTVAWGLRPDGEDYSIRFGPGGIVLKEQRYGYWYLQGRLADTTGRALCFKARPRDGATCYPFALDVVPPTPPDTVTRRRIVIAGYKGQQHVRTRVLIERLP